ncbi:hypothetical protein [Mammaliicoccus virus vB_MscM-PMS2]|nr:hypothetical protein [Mammaliicoccus virus vB_MscM-PMS2]
MTKDKSIVDIISHDMSLGDMIGSPTEEERKEGNDIACDILTDIVKDMFSTYEFRRFDPTEDDKTSSNSIQFKASGANQQRLFKLAKLFKTFFDYRLTVQDCNKEFTKRVKNGDVIKLGGVVVTGVLFTNPMENPDITIIIDFMPKDKYELNQEIKKKQQEKIEKAKKDKSDTNE